MNRITTQDIRLSIDFYKGLKGQDWSLFNFGFMRNQSQIHQYINTNENRMYNRSELISIESYVYITYHALMVAYGECHCVLRKEALEVIRKQYNHKEILTTDIGPEIELEHYLKILIHGDSSIKQKNVIGIIATVCAFIELYVKVMVKLDCSE
jgi:hypothetical protein